MAQVTLILTLILAGVLVLLGAQNTETVTLHFLWFTARSMPLSLALLGGAAIGGLLALLVGLPNRVRRTRMGREFKRHNARQQTQIAQLQATAAAEEQAARA